jgi:nucleoside-diphosphate-sugar epimerase
VSRVLVTGGAGFIGGNLVEALLEAGHSVTVLDDLSSGGRERVPGGARLVEGSIVDAKALDDAFADKPEIVFHLAALFANQNSVDHPARDLDVNGIGTVRMLEWSQASGVGKFLYTSSSCVYGGMAEMREEDAPGHLETPYAISKYMGERYCRFWSEHHGLDTVIVRLFNAYGPGELPGRYRNVIPNFIALALRGEPLPITGEGSETRDFTFVSDTVRGMMLAVAAETTPADAYNLGTGQPTQILALAHAINDLTANPAGVVFRPRRGWDHTPHRRGVVEKAAHELGFTAEADLHSGLARTVEWLRRHA